MAHCAIVGHGRAARLARPPLLAASTWLVLALVNAYFFAGTWYGILQRGFDQTDFRVLQAAATSAQPYLSTDYRWSPLLLPLLALITALPFATWVALHVAAALALPGWPMRSVVLLSWPFWEDVDKGNVLVFVLLATVWALRGSRVGQLTFLALAVLIPRPLMVPVLLWLLWREPSLRRPFILAAVVVVLTAVWLDPLWFPKVLSSGADMGNAYQLAPSRWIGIAWIPIGLALAGWQWWRGRLGLASLAASPYLLPYYLLMGAVDLLRLAPVGGRDE